MDIFNFAFVRTSDIAALENAIIYINRSRHSPIQYNRIIQTASRDGWAALILDSVLPDHYLMRNISGRLHTRSFEIGTNGISIYYRVHQDGQTTSAFESHLALWITQKLRLILSTGDITRIDLAEPAGRLVLKRYHEHQRSRAWSQPSANEKIPPEVEDFYAGQISQLRDLLEPGMDSNYVQDIIKPGFAANHALSRLVSALALPYFKGEPVYIEKESELELDTAKIDALHSGQISLEMTGKKSIKDFAVLQPSTWPPHQPLPKGWLSVGREKWTQS